jgi:putative endonuclease
MPPLTSSKSLGRRGEELAADYLCRLGFGIRETNVRSRLGEIDIIADAPRDNGEPLLVFVEVKTRRGAVFGSPVEAVNARKQRQLTRLAEAYLQQHPELGQRTCRFDVIGIRIEALGEIRIDHIPGAF